MKQKSWTLNLIYLILIVSLYIRGSTLLNNEFNKFTTTFKRSYLNIAIIHLVFFGGIGVVLGLEKLFKEKGKNGKWKINISKLILLGIPSFIFSISMFIPVISLHTMRYSSTLYIVSSIILGHTLISSLYKEDSMDLKDISS